MSNFDDNSLMTNMPNVINRLHTNGATMHLTTKRKTPKMFSPKKSKRCVTMSNPRGAVRF